MSLKAPNGIDERSLPCRDLEKHKAYASHDITIQTAKINYNITPINAKSYRHYIA